MPTVLDTSTSRRDSDGSPESLEGRLSRMAHAFLVLFLEVEAGLRPRRQLQRLMSPLLYARLSDVWLRPGQDVPVVRRLHTIHPSPGRFDVVATVDRRTRITALAFSLRRHAGGWRVDDLVRPEEGPLPEPPFPIPSDEPDTFELVLV